MPQYKLQLDTSQDELLLYNLLRSQPERSIWSKDTPYSNFGNTHILPNTILVINDRFLILENTEIGSGSFGKVVPINRVFRFTEVGKIDYIDSQPLVAKISYKDEKEASSSFMLRLKKEYEISRRLDHLSMQRPIYHGNGTVAYLVMKRMPGEEMYYVLESITNKGVKYPVKFLLMLTDKLLDAFQRQIADHMINHLDVKPENIMLDVGKKINESDNNYLEELSLQQVQVNFVDFGFSREQGTLLRTVCGSIDYVAPEFYNNKRFFDEKVDMFSIGVILQLAWGLYSQKQAKDILTRGAINITDQAISSLYALKYAEQAEHFSLDLLYKITILTVNMVRIQPSDRWSLQQVRMAFDAIIHISPYASYLLPSLPYTPELDEEPTPSVESVTPRESLVVFVSKMIYFQFRNTLTNTAQGIFRSPFCLLVMAQLNQWRESLAIEEAREPMVRVDTKLYSCSRRSMVSFNSYNLFFKQQNSQHFDFLERAAEGEFRYRPPTITAIHAGISINDDSEEKSNLTNRRVI